MAYIEIVDGEGNLRAAMNDNNLGCVIYDFWDLGEYGSAEYHTFGDWLSVSYNGGSDETEFEDADHDFQPFMQGWLLVPETQKLGLLEITEVDAANDLVITKGDASGMAGTGGRYWIIPPAGVNSVTGAIETDPCRMGSLWLWAGYHYRAPIAGFHIDPEGEPALGVYGKQNGPNQAGTYECWNRVYEPQTGRWTTPDPAMSPWWNLTDYVYNNPATFVDSTGLHTLEASLRRAIENCDAQEMGEYLDGIRKKLADQAYYDEQFRRVAEKLQELDCMGAPSFVRFPYLAELEERRKALIGHQADIDSRICNGFGRILRDILDGRLRPNCPDYTDAHGMTSKLWDVLKALKELCPQGWAIESIWDLINLSAWSAARNAQGHAETSTGSGSATGAGGGIDVVGGVVGLGAAAGGSGTAGRGAGSSSGGGAGKGTGAGTGQSGAGKVTPLGFLRRAAGAFGGVFFPYPGWIFPHDDVLDPTPRIGDLSEREA